MAKVLAYRGSCEESEQLARAPSRSASETDMVLSSGLAHLDLVRSARGGRPYGAKLRLRPSMALGLFERKGDLPMADQARARLARLL